MQHHGLNANVVCIVGGTGAGVVGHHAPALRCFVKHVSGNDPGLLGALRGHDFNPLHQMVNGTGQGFDFVNALRIGLDIAIGKHGLKRCADSARPDQARSTRVDAHNVLFNSPTAHEFLNVCGVQCLVERIFTVVCTATQGRGSKFGLCPRV